MRHAESAQATSRGNLGAVAGHDSRVRVVVGAGMAIRLYDRFAASPDAPQDAKTEDTPEQEAGGHEEFSSEVR